MPDDEMWKIVDSRTGSRVSITSFFTEEQCWRQISQWQDRHDRGGRPDITRELLLHMKPEREDV